MTDIHALLLALGFVLPAPQSYISGGLFVADSHMDSRISETPNPIGRIEAGVRYGGFSISAFHLSSAATKKDRGANYIGLSYEFNSGP